MKMKKMMMLAVVCATMLAAIAEDEMTEEAFFKAYNEGRPLTAERIYRAIGERSDIKPIIHFQAAEEAKAQGKDVLVKDRLQRFLRAEKAWTPEKRQTAWELSRRTLDAMPCVELLNNEQPTMFLRNEALRLVDKFREAKRPVEVMKIADAYLPKYPSYADRLAMVSRLLSMANENQPNYTAKEAGAYLEKYPIKGKDCLNFIDRNEWYCNAKWRLDLMTSQKELLPYNYFEYVVSWNGGRLVGCFLDKDKKVTDPKALAEYKKKFLALESMITPEVDFAYHMTMAYMKRAFRDVTPYCFDTNKFEQIGFDILKMGLPLVKKNGDATWNGLNNFAWSWLSDRSVTTGAAWGRYRANFERVFSNHMKLNYGGALDQARAAKSPQPILDLLNRYPDDFGLKVEACRALAQWGETKVATQTLLDYAVNNPSGDGNFWLYALNDFPTNKLSIAQKAELLLKAAQLAGSTPMLKWMTDAARQKNWQRELYKYPEMTAAAQKIQAGIRNPHRLAELRDEMYGLKRLEGNKCPPRAFEIVDEALKLYPERPPMAGRSERDTTLFRDLLTRCWYELCRWEPEAAARMMKALTGHVWVNFDGNWCWEMVNNAIRGKVVTSKEVDAFSIDLMTIDKANYKGLCRYNAFYHMPSNSVALPAGITLKDLSFEELYCLLESQMAFMKPEFRLATIKEFFSRDTKEWNYRVDQMLSWVIPALANNYKQTTIYKDLPWPELEKNILFTPNQDGYGWQMRLLTYAKYAGRYDLLNRWIELVKQMERPAVLSRLNELLCQDVFKPVDPKNPKDDALAAFIEGVYLPTLKSIPTRDAPMYTILDSHRNVEYRVRDEYWWRNEANRTNATRLATLKSFGEEMTRLSWAGIRGGGLTYFAPTTFGNVLASGKTEPRLGLYAHLAAAWWDHSVGEEWALKLMQEMEDRKLWEPLYLFADALQAKTYLSENFRKAVVLRRANVSTKLPGIYPVNEKDPSYPLYVAADEYQQNSTERAWALLQKNMTVFERVALNLPPTFTAWAVEQLRLSRGLKGVNIEKARELATQLLDQPDRLTPELAASLMLTRAETYRDQQNFEAAKLEYESIRNQAKFAGTKAARKAMFRAIDLMIDTGTGAQAEQTLEYWLSQPDAEIQAQAHYFFAKIAFERGEFDEVDKQLKEVFSINFTHTEGRFLQGKWKLATNHEVDETEVLIGTLNDRSTVKPGQQLQISIQDRNLSVAGGGAAIPIVARTIPGGDYEIVNLYPSQRDPTLFKGMIDVRLARPVLTNLVLDVSGNDKVTYEVDPEFVKSRGLKPTKAKTLTIVDDGRLAIGAGAPKADKDGNVEYADAVAAMVDDQSKSNVGVIRTLRPGNPFYMAVSDKDRSVGSNSTVTVDIQTSSGDSIKGYVLKEARPYSGVFRGEVPTALPPPRAYASDTASGFNAGDVINSTRDGVWRSVSDSKPGKWLAVDTMSSHLVSNVVLVMDQPEVIRGIRLTGTLGGEKITLGSLPAGKVENRLGLRRQHQWGGETKGMDAMKAAMDSDKAVKTTLVTNFVFKSMARGNRREFQTGRQWGYFRQGNESSVFRCRVRPLSGDMEAMKSAWVQVVLDGKRIFDVNGIKLQGAGGSARCLPGVHKLEIYWSMVGENDDFELISVKPGTDGEPIEIGMFDWKKFPEIVEAASDKAVISRTKDGFQATVADPVRLREVRWEFIDCNAPDITVKSLTLVNEKGEAVLPVKCDFSDTQKNDTLEVAPGDRITVSYTDQITSKGAKRTMTQSMDSRFNDGTVGCYYEAFGVDSNGHETYNVYSLYRVCPGDTIILRVADSDLDLSAEADTVKMRLTTTSGVEREIELHEQERVGAKADEGVHTGVFVEYLNTAAKGDKEADEDTLLIDDSDTITVEYMDRENTSPGVPTMRSFSVPVVKETEPALTLFHTWNVRVPDNSPAAQNRLASLRKRPGNEHVTNMWTSMTFAKPMDTATCNETNKEILVNATAPVLVCVTCPSAARHAASSVKIELVSGSELKRADDANEEPNAIKTRMGLGLGFGNVRMSGFLNMGLDPRDTGDFGRAFKLAIGATDVGRASRAHGEVPPLRVNGNDWIRLRILSEEEDRVLMERRLRLVSNGSIALMNSTWEAERTKVHVGEKLFFQVTDADRDESPDPDRIEATVRSLQTGRFRKLVMTETLPHSGVFTATLTPTLFMTNDIVPKAVTGGVATAEQLIADDRFSVGYGDTLVFDYNDERTIPGTPARTLSVTGTVFKGSNGKIRMFAKHFRDSDTAVLVQFRLAECLFEQAKDFRKLKQRERSAQAIAEGKFILEEALKAYPDSIHAMQGEYLLANLHQELAEDKLSDKEHKDEEGARQLLSEALSRFSQMLAIWPEGEYAAKAQFHKAYCLEKLKDFRSASEEYVKMTYIYPDSELVGDATIRLATYYFREVKRYDVAGRIYANFAKRFPNHSKAARALFMSGSCFIKQAQSIVAEAKKKGATVPNVSDYYMQAVRVYERVALEFTATTTPELRAQALYWAGDSALRGGQARQAYIFLKRTTFEYPETEWARRARGLLLQESRAFEGIE